MNHGMYISASGMSVGMARQDVLSNNLANVNTVGFKPDILSTRQRDPARIEDGLMSLPSNALLERLGAGVMPMPTTVNVAQATIERTDRALDVALEGEGFLVVRAGPGTEGLRVTRDGRMVAASDGTLVTATEGRPILGANGQPIRIDRNRPIDIDGQGRIRQGAEEIGQLRIAAAANPERLIKAGSGLLRAAPGSELELSAGAAMLRQGHLEGSGTNPIEAMMGVTAASRAVESNSRMIGYINELMGFAVNRLGRVN